MNEIDLFSVFIGHEKEEPTVTHDTQKASSNRAVRHRKPANKSPDRDPEGQQKEEDRAVRRNKGEEG
jgi:hypothetical protein